MSRLLVTGGAGFIGSQFVRTALEAGHVPVVLDALTYAGHYPNIEALVKENRVRFYEGSIADRALVSRILRDERIDAVVNFAAESHVDNSITGPRVFLETNILGTFEMLEASRAYLSSLSEEGKKNFRFVQVSTDEVFGSLGAEGKFSEDNRYEPNSPYSASKAGADHLVRAWYHTYGLPTLITNCSNNYGPRQFPEKLIPRMIVTALAGGKLPIYGRGENIRDWIHVEDHASGVLLALTKGQVGEAYCFGGNSERRNIDVVKQICVLLDELRPRAAGGSYAEQMSFVEDRLGHDFRYAIDDSKALRELGYQRAHLNFEAGLRATVQWYLDNEAWVRSVQQKKKA
ncbi:MAG TPA: dTDP-glucose 4,6-dehydratase [Pseudobdellovibrionaceae bacterium]|nr:dTDP-glucose 4,6-dehydratase [Pseudobdellovibrionaceae bacterium]